MTISITVLVMEITGGLQASGFPPSLRGILALLTPSPSLTAAERESIILHLTASIAQLKAMHPLWPSA